MAMKRKRTLAEIGEELRRNLASLETAIAGGKRRVGTDVLESIKRVLERGTRKKPRKRHAKTNA
jgi:hypothetical protein